MKAYIARDKDGTAYVYTRRPHKRQSTWVSSMLSSFLINNTDLPEGINPQWEDDEPIEVELTIKKI